MTKNKHGAPSRTVISRLLPLICISASIALSGCTEPEPASGSETESAQTYVAPPEYAQQDGDLFMYVGELSEEATEGGERNPVVTFKYLGQEGDQHRLEMVNDNGSRISLMECSNPCRVARQTDAFGSMTRVAVNPGTIMDAAFQDAFNGWLDVANSPTQPLRRSQTSNAPSLIEPSSASDWRGERGSCRLKVDEKVYITGDCWIRLEDDGSFQIMSLDEQYFAQLSRSGIEALGFWNQTPYSTHAHSVLGEMDRSGACWKNSRAEICAWAAS